MKVLAVFAAVVAVSSAQILYSNHLGVQQIGLGYSTLAAPAVQHLGYNAVAAAPAVVAAPAVPVATKTQYHAQDELGQASFGHSQPGQAHAAVRDAAGGVSGTFSYISPEGIPFTTHYRADHNGYRVASNALPVAPSVAIAGPIDTPEVAAAKAQHAAAHADALIRSGRKKRGVVAPVTTYAAAVPALTQSYAYSAPIYSAPVTTYAAPAVRTVAAAPVVSTYAAAVPALTHSYAYSAPVYSAPAVVKTAVAAPVTYAAAPVTYAAAPAAVVSTAAVPAATVVAAPAATVVAAPAVRAATLTKVVNTPGHAVSYRVD